MKKEHLGPPDKGKAEEPRHRAGLRKGLCSLRAALGQPPLAQAPVNPGCKHVFPSQSPLTLPGYHSETLPIMSDNL